ncbi:hypothetical protein ABK040_011006 [Willaertia magna]
MSNNNNFSQIDDLSDEDLSLGDVSHILEEEEKPSTSTITIIKKPLGLTNFLEQVEQLEKSSTSSSISNPPKQQQEEEKQPKEEKNETNNTEEVKPVRKSKFGALFGGGLGVKPTEQKTNNETTAKSNDNGIINKLAMLLNREERAIVESLNGTAKDIVNQFTTNGFDHFSLKIISEVLYICDKMSDYEPNPKNEEEYKYHKWVKSFVECGGVIAISNCLSSCAMQNGHFAKQNTHQTNTEQQNIENLQTLCLKIIETLLNVSKVARDSVFETKDLVTNMVLNLDSPVLGIRSQILMILCVVMTIHPDDDGFEYVTDAMTSFRLVKREDKRFQFFIESIRAYQAKDLLYLLSSITFLNSLLNCTPNDSVKMLFVKELCDNFDLQLIVTELNESVDKLLKENKDSIGSVEESLIRNITTQLDILEGELQDTLEQDLLTNALATSFGSFDVQDPVEVVKVINSLLLSSTAKHVRNARDNFVDILTAILKYSHKAFTNDNFETSEFENSFQALENVVKNSLNDDTLSAKIVTEREIELNESVKAQQKKIDELEKEANKLRTENFKLSQNLEQLKSDKEETKKLQGEIKLAEDKDWKKEVDSLRDELNTLKQKYADLEKENEKLRSTNISQKKEESNSINTPKIEKEDNIIVNQGSTNTIPVPPGMGVPAPPSLPTPPGLGGIPTPPGMGTIPMPPGMNVPTPPGMTGIPVPPINGPPNGVPMAPPGFGVPTVPGVGIPMAPSFGNKLGLPKLPTKKPNKKTKALYFDEIKNNKVMETIFIKNNIAQRTCELVEKIDLIVVEDAFENVTKTTAVVKEEKKGPTIRNIIDAAKSQNSSIVLKSLPRKENETDVQKVIRYVHVIINMDEKEVDEKLLETLPKAIPEIEVDKEKEAERKKAKKEGKELPEEPIDPESDPLTKVKAYTDNLAKEGKKKEEGVVYPLAEEFLLELVDVPNIRERLQAWSFKFKELSLYSSVSSKFESLFGGIDQVTGSKLFHDILAIILTLHNFINSGSGRKPIYGFHLPTIGKLLDTKSKDVKRSLLHLVVELIESSFPHLLNFAEEINLVNGCSRIELKSLDDEYKEYKMQCKEYQKFVADMKQLKEKGKLLPNDRVVECLEQYLEEINHHISSIEEKQSSLTKKLQELSVLFDDAEIAKEPKTFFSTIQHFISSIELVREDIKQRKAKLEKEEKRKLEEENRKKIRESLLATKKPTQSKSSSSKFFSSGSSSLLSQCTGINESSNDAIADRVIKMIKLDKANTFFEKLGQLANLKDIPSSTESTPSEKDKTHDLFQNMVKGNFLDRKKASAKKALTTVKQTTSKVYHRVRDTL